jgi:hypothetical protein
LHEHKLSVHCYGITNIWVEATGICLNTRSWRINREYIRSIYLQKHLRICNVEDKFIEFGYPSIIIIYQTNSNALVWVFF